MIKQLGKTMEALEKMEDEIANMRKTIGKMVKNKHNWAKLGDKLWKVRF